MSIRKIILLFNVVFVLGILTHFSTALAQVPGEEVALSGTFQIIWGDQKGGQSHILYTLTDATGLVTILQIDQSLLKQSGGALSFNGKLIDIKGILVVPPLPTVKTFSPDAPAKATPAEVKVKTITLGKASQILAPLSSPVQLLAAVSGSHPWVTIMCKFNDIATEPNDVAYFQGMYGDSWPGLNHYWKELSFNTADIAGSTVGGNWQTLPHDEIFYNPTDTEKGTNLNLLADECVAAADADVDYSLYSGINMMFNSDFDNGWAWGGSRTMTLDGVTRSWSITWEPPWSYANISVIAHEMGHGFGLPHSTAPGDGVYDNPWDVMSQDRYNCAAATDTTYGCVAQHTISYHKDLLEWIPAPRKTTLASGSKITITLEDLAVPASANYQMVRIPIGGSATNFYTVEARRFTGYDIKLPEEGIVIHNVDVTADEPAHLVPDLGNNENAWSAGERYIDAANSIAVMVNSDTGSGFNVTVSNGDLPPTSNANGPYAEECAGGTTVVSLDGTGSSDPEGGDLTYSWTTSCDGTFDDPTSSQPTLTINTANLCDNSCNVSLTVTDDFGLSSTAATSIVTIYDTVPPTLSGVPGDATVECDAVPEPATVTVTDICSTDPTLNYTEDRTDGSCADNYTLSRSWTGSDSCGNESSGYQTITVQDTQPPVINCGSPATITPVDAPVSFTATASDNCDESLTVALTGYQCFMTTKKGKVINKNESCVVELAGNTITIVDSGGVDDHITWTAQTTDNCGNFTETTCSVVVVNPSL